MPYEELPIVNTGNPAKHTWANQVRDNFIELERRIGSSSERVDYDKIVYVGESGSDTTGDGSLASPYLSINRAVADIASNTMEEDAHITIQVLDGTYNFTEPQVIRSTGKFIYLRGNPSTPTNVNLNFNLSSYYPMDMATMEPLPMGCVAAVDSNVGVSGFNITLTNDMAGVTQICHCVLFQRATGLIDSSILTNEFARGTAVVDNSKVILAPMDQLDIKAQEVGMFVSRGSQQLVYGLVNVEPYTASNGTAMLSVGSRNTDAQYANIIAGWSVNESYGYDDAEFPHVGVSANDTTRNYLNNKISVSSPLSKAILNPGADEQVEVSLSTSGNATEYLDGSGNWSVPAGSGGSGTSVAITSADSPYTVSNTVSTLYIDASGGDVSVTVSNDDQYELKIKLTADPGSNTVTIQMSSGNIDGSATYTGLNTLLQSIVVVGDGTDGWIF